MHATLAIDPTDNQEKELAEEQKMEIAATYLTRIGLRNENSHADKKKFPLDVTYYDRDDFIEFIEFINTIFDANNPIAYDHQRATMNMRKAEQHKAEMARITAATANTTMAAGGTFNITGGSSGASPSSSGGGQTQTYTPPNAKDRAVMEQLKNFNKF